jgi:hypothetical protein
MKPILAAIALAILITPARGRAGEYSTNGTFGPYCSKATNGSGYCMGNPSSFRASSDPSAYMDVETTGSYGSFDAYLFNVFYACTTVDPKLIAQLNAVGPQGVTVIVEWDTTGTCTMVYREANSSTPF